MNKSIALKQLQIPPDITDYICSFLFYTIDESIQHTKQKFTSVVNDLFYTVRIDKPYISGLFHSHLHIYSTMFIYNVQSTFDIQFYICNPCGNYIQPTKKCNCTILKYNK